MDDQGNATQNQDTQVVILQLDATLKLMRRTKRNDRSEKDRRQAIAITELEKVIAYIQVYC